MPSDAQAFIDRSNNNDTRTAPHFALEDVVVVTVGLTTSIMEKPKTIGAKNERFPANQFYRVIIDYY